MFLTNETLQAICRTFLHSIWQGMIAAALAGIILWATRRSSARTRYNLLGSLLLLTLLATCITFYTELRPTAAAIADITGTDIVTASAVLPSHPGEQVINYINTHADWLMLIWAVVFLLKCFRLGGGFYHIYRIRRVHVQPVPTAWEDTLKRLSHSLKIRKAVQLLESGIAKTPLTIGFFKPVIFLPLGLLAQLPADQVETILLHELAHIRRRDYFLNILQSFAETIFFFNPAFLWISARLREEREACCDDIVVAHTPHKATYFHALVAFEEQAALGTSLQIGLGSTRNHLLHRVKRMLTRENKKLSLMEKISLIFGLIAITAFSFMPEKEVPVPPLAVIQEVQLPVIIKEAPVPPPAVLKEATVLPSVAAKLAVPVAAPVCLPVPEDTALIAKKDKWVNKPAPSKKSKDKWKSEPSKEDNWATKKKVAATDTVKFSSPAFKKKWASSTNTVKSTKPAFKKKKAITANTVVFKDKKSPPALTEKNGLPSNKHWTEAAAKSKIEKKAISGDRPSIKKTAPPALKPADKNIKKKEEVNQQGSKFFDDYLPEALRQKKTGKDNC